MAPIYQGFHLYIEYRITNDVFARFVKQRPESTSPDPRRAHLGERQLNIRGDGYICQS
jgi:hypothetical protein